MAPDPHSSRSLWLLGLGSAAGLALAAFGLLDAGPDARGSLPSGSIARVNDTAIRADDYWRLVASVENDTREAANDAVRARVLERMIDEELLVQRALELGLAQVDRRVRANLVSSLIASVTAEAETREASDAELREFFARESAFFSQPGRLHMRQVFFRVRDSRRDVATRERAVAAARRLRAGEAFEVVRAALGDEEISPIPDGLLPPQKLLEYTGPTVLRASLELETGEVSDPVRSGTGYHVLLRAGGEPPRTPEFEEVVELVRSEWTRRAGDRALREYLDDLRAGADIASADVRVVE